MSARRKQRYVLSPMSPPLHESPQCVRARWHRLAHEDLLHREVIRLFSEQLALGRGGDGVLDGLRAAGWLLLAVGLRYREAIDEWEYQHDMLVIGVPIKSGA